MENDVIQGHDSHGIKERKSLIKCRLTACFNLILSTNFKPLKYKVVVLPR